MITVKFYGDACFNQRAKIELPANSTLDDIQKALNEWLLDWIYDSYFEFESEKDEEIIRRKEREGGR